MSVEVTRGHTTFALLRQEIHSDQRYKTPYWVGIHRDPISEIRNSGICYAVLRFPACFIEIYPQHASSDFLDFYPEQRSYSLIYARDPLGSTISLDHRSDTTSSIGDPLRSKIQSRKLEGSNGIQDLLVKLHQGILLDDGSNTVISEIFWDHISDFGILGYLPLTLARTWGIPAPRWFLFPAPHTVWEKEMIFFLLYSCISNLFSRYPENFKSLDLSLWDDLFLEVMSGRIFAKFDIAPKAQLWPEHFETDSVRYRYMTLQIVYLGVVIIDLRSGQFRDLPIIWQWGKIASTSNTYQIASNRSERWWIWLRSTSPCNLH